MHSFILQELVLKRVLVCVCCRFSVDMSKYPTIVRIKEALEQLPAFIAADAKNQPDTPDDLKA